MSDLRKAAEMALWALEDIFGKEKVDVGAINALRQALTQPEQEQYVTKVVAMHEDGTYTTERIPLPKREWVGLTDEEVEVWRGNYDFFDSALVREVEAKLKEKNT